MRNNWELILDSRLAVDNMNPSQQMYTAIDHEVFWFATLVDANEYTIYSNLTCYFPVCSFSGR